jgi:hypothetical protein
MSDKPAVCEIQKNARETIRFRLGEFKGHKFVDMRVFAQEDGKDPAPTKKGLAVSPTLWLRFRAAMDQTEAAMVEQGWIDKADLEAQTG